MVVETLLDNLHLFDDSFFRILLHTRINGSIDFQAIPVKVNIILITPFAEVICYGITVIECLSVVVILHTIVKVDGLLCQRVVCFLRDILMFEHVVQHHIPSVERVFRIDTRIIISGSLQQSYEDSTLIRCEFLWRRPEICLCRCFDTKSIRAEIYRIGIHRENLFLVEEHLQLHGSNPLLAFHDEHFHAGDIAEKSRRILRTDTEHVLDQLLCDGRSTTCIVMNDIILEGSEHTLEVNTEMLIVTLVLCINQSTPENRVNILILNRSTILAEVFSNQFTIGTI